MLQDVSILIGFAQTGAFEAILIKLFMFFLYFFPTPSETLVIPDSKNLVFKEAEEELEDEESFNEMEDHITELESVPKDLLMVLQKRG